MVRVFDCFLFNDELDLLKHRLKTLADVVTTFVVVEADTTFQGRKKPLHYTNNRARFRDWQQQIRHVVVDLGDEMESWERQRKQHRAFSANLGDASDDDLVLVGDCDELPFPTVVRRLAEEVHPPTRLHMMHAVYWANTVRRQRWTDGTEAFRWRDRDHLALGVLLGHPDAVWGRVSDPASIADGGWHLSDIGDVSWIGGKLSSLSAVELSAPRVSAPAHMQRCRRLGIDYRSGEPLDILGEGCVPAEIRRIREVSPVAIRLTKFPPPPIRLLYAAFTTTGGGSRPASSSGQISISSCSLRSSGRRS